MTRSKGASRPGAAAEGQGPQALGVIAGRQCLQVLLDDGVRKYVWGLGLAYAVDTSGSPLVYHSDGLGSVRALTDSAGSVVQTYQYDEYGVVTSSSGSATQPFGYTGEQRDGETGFMYVRARYYDPASGRFVTKDPLAGTVGSPLNLHRYAYSKNNPIMLADHAGLTPQEQSGLPDGWTDEMVRETLYGNGKVFDSFDWDAIAYGSPIDKVIFAVITLGSGGRSLAAGGLSRFVGVAGREAVLSKVVLSDGSLNPSQTVARQLAQERRFIPIQGILEAIGTGARVPDPQGVAGHFMCSIEASYGKSNGVLEVLVDEASGQIGHVLYRSK